MSIIYAHINNRLERVVVGRREALVHDEARDPLGLPRTEISRLQDRSEGALRVGKSVLTSGSSWKGRIAQ